MANMTFGVNIIPKDDTVSLGTSQNKWKINGVDDPKLTDTTYSNVTTSTDGLMSAADKIKLNGIEAGAEINPDIVNNLTETTAGKILDATQGKILNDNKLDKDFSNSNYSSAATPFSGNEKIPIQQSGNNVYTDFNTLSTYFGGSSNSQVSLVNYKTTTPNFSSLSQSFTDSNVTSQMVVLDAVLSNPAAQTSDWEIVTSDGSYTISGSISGTTNITITFGIAPTTSPSILTNLSSTTAANILSETPRPGITGVLPVSYGGTGAENSADARTNLDVYSKSEVNSKFSQWYTSNTSFTAAVTSWGGDNDKGYVAAALEWIETNIGNYSGSNIVTPVTPGPSLSAVFVKGNATNYGGILFSYYRMNYFLQFRRIDGFFGVRPIM